MESREQVWPAARITFAGALLLLTVTVVIGILNGIDVYTPDHDTLVGHVHSGTLGWITLALAGVILLAFSRGRSLTAEDVRRATALAWMTTLSTILYVAAFFAGDLLPGNRIDRPIAGTILLAVMVWFLAWMVRNRVPGSQTVAKLGFLLAWISLVIGAVFGIVLGLFLSRGTVPGLSASTSTAIADAHPPALVVGFLILASMAMIEWLLGDRTIRESRSGAFQMWLLFGAGIVVNIAFLARLDDSLLPPANLAMIVGVITVLARRRRDLTPSAWRQGGTATFPRMSAFFLVVYLGVLTVIVVRVVGGSMNLDGLSPEDKGLLTAFDHLMFIGVMTNALFGALALSSHGSRATVADRVLLWGLNVGVAGFSVGLIMVEALPKRIFTPIMGVALLLGVVAHLRGLSVDNQPVRVPSG